VHSAECLRSERTRKQPKPSFRAQAGHRGGRQGFREVEGADQHRGGAQESLARRVTVPVAPQTVQSVVDNRPAVDRRRVREDRQQTRIEFVDRQTLGDGHDPLPCLGSWLRPEAAQGRAPEDP
jgi:hypothetical protein